MSAEVPPLLDEGSLSLVFESVDDATLLELRCASRASKRLADEALRKNFTRRWGAASVQGEPGPAALAAAKLCHFARLAIVGRHDTLAAIALRYNADPHVLRRLNNVLSEHTLASRTHVFIPVHDAEVIRGQDIEFRRCPAAKRNWLVVSPPSCASSIAPAVAAPATDQARAKLAALMGQSLRIDVSTAAYYIAACDGDIKAAMAAFEDDRRWDRSMKGLRKALVAAGRRRC